MPNPYTDISNDFKKVSNEFNRLSIQPPSVLIWKHLSHYFKELSITAAGIIPAGLSNLQEVTDIGAITTNAINTGGITTDYVQLDTTATPTLQPGMFGWNDVDGTADLRLKGGNVTLQVGQENVVRVVNKTGANLLESQYKVVRVRIASEGGAQGQRLAVVLAQGDNDPDSVTTLGIVTENIDKNQEGFITVFGNVNKINTTGSLQGETWVDGDVLFLSPTTPGGLTKVKPTAPQHTVVMGYVVYAHANNGKIFVKVDNGYELEELHDVLPTPYVNNGVLYRDTSTNLWKSATISTLLGGTPLLTVPTLAQVTTAGNTTTNTVSVGKLLVNTTTDAGYRLDVNGTFRVQNSSLNTLVASAGAISGRVDSLTFNTTTNTYYGLVFTPHNSDGEIRFRNSNSASIVSEGRLFSISTSTTNTGFSGSAFTFTGGTSVVAGQGSGATWNIFNFNPVIATPNAGAGTYNILLVGGSLDFTGGGTGITRGIYINPTLTSLSTFIGLEIAKGKVITSSSVTASAALAQGVYFNNTLVAAANNDVLVGLDINPTFTNGAFSGVSNYALRVTGTNVALFDSVLYSQAGPSANNTSFSITGTTNSNYTLFSNRNFIFNTGQSMYFNTDIDGGGVTERNWYFAGGRSGMTGGRTYVAITTNSSGFPRLIIYNNDNSATINLDSNAASYFNGGNVLVGTTTDAGYRLDVNGTARVSGNLTVDTNTLFVDATNDRVGIGTTSPTQKFQVGTGSALIGTVDTYGDAHTKLYVHSTTGAVNIVLNPRPTAGDIYYRVKLGVDVNSNGSFYVQHEGAGKIIEAWNSGGYLNFSPVVSLGEKKWTLETNGYGLQMYSPYGWSSVVRYTNAASGTTATDGALTGITENGDFRVWTYESHPMLFATANVERMRITSSGNIGIGTLTPNAKLDVQGVVSASLGFKANNQQGINGDINVGGQIFHFEMGILTTIT